MKHALVTSLLWTGGVLLLALMFVLALGETILRGKKVLDCGLDEDTP